ncbi:MAG: isocitrate dehydrogenase [Deltaproteobacteria bacterium]|nr:isocitrate dehydrogenase [Deltaproteobacteria bacterium]
MKTYRVVELLGDGISAELCESVHRMAESVPCKIEFLAVDLSLEGRARAGGAVYDQAVHAMRSTGVGLKYPTVTSDESPNQIIRDRCDFAVIHRPVMTLPGIQTNFTKNLDIDVVRVATGGTYDDQGRRIGSDTAVALRVIERQPCRHAAKFAFKLAMIRGTGVVSTSKYTIQKAADGLFEEACELVSRDYPGIPYRRELFDALLASVIMRPERYGVIVCPNEYGDFLSDMACGLIGSIGLGDSASFAFDEQGAVTLALFDPAGGTAPDIAGKGVCNPTAALLAFASLLRHVGEIKAGEALRKEIRGAIADGQRTRDIGGTMNTREFTDAVAERLRKAMS